jgi:hypothetical protein
MAAIQTEIESQVAELSKEAFVAFCDDISGMFGVGIKCTPDEACIETVKELQERFQKLVVVHSVKAEGTLNGTFHLIFGQEGLFITAGLIAMPEQMTSLVERCVGPQQIMENIKSGSLKKAEEMSDTLTEAGNMMVFVGQGLPRGIRRAQTLFTCQYLYWQTVVQPQEKNRLGSQRRVAVCFLQNDSQSLSNFQLWCYFPKKHF